MLHRPQSAVLSRAPCPARRRTSQPRQLRFLAEVPAYAGQHFVGATFPARTEGWPKFSSARTAQACGDIYDVSLDELRAYAAGKVWVSPPRTTFFLCDQHADAAAFFRSLVASGGIAKTGPNAADCELTEAGHEGQFVIGGDCLDKGPTNLGLLRSLKALIDSGAHVEILAGNHDVRALVGLEYLGRKEPHLAHLFVRMGMKSVPLFREIYDTFVKDAEVGQSEAEIARLLYPAPDWFQAFPASVSAILSERRVALELARIQEKIDEFDAERRRQGMTLGMVYAAAQAARAQFLQPDGEFYWFFERMKLAKRSGSILFIHAGVDDSIATLLRREGVDALNREFRRLLATDLFTLYHGPVGNTFRTKYRQHEFPLTSAGARELQRAGIHAVVHGHRNIPRGQRILLRRGLLNFECDTTVDSNTRKLLALRGPGGGVTIFNPKGTVLGISTDYPYVKRFDATRLFEMNRVHAFQSRRDRVGRNRQRKGVMTMSEKSEVTFESQMTVEEAISYFEAIIGSLKRGSVTITQAGKTLTLEPGQTMKVEVEAERKKNKEEIAIKMKWKTRVPELLISGNTQ